RGVTLRRDSTDEDVHELPLSDFCEQSVPRAGARELRYGQADSVDPRERFAGLRVLRPQHPYQQRRRLYDVSWPGRSDAAHVAGAIASDGMVPRLSPES